MRQRVRHVISPEKLFAKWKANDVVIVDCRFVLSQPEAGYEAYVKEHIPGAFYLDLERDLSGPVKEDGSGGRHPLPDLEELAKKLARIGVSNETTVVAYDEQGGMVAARFWWLLSYMGHENVFVLDGGFSAWKQADYPIVYGVREEKARNETAQFIPKIQKDWVVTAEDIAARRKLIEEGKVVLMDSREDARYRGIAEPIDKKAGHIPGARHFFWKANLDSEGRFRSLKEQMTRFEPLQSAEEIIVYCGSGVSACPNVLALREIGFKNVKLYAGSWSDWISNPDNPIATGQE